MKPKDLRARIGLVMHDLGRADAMGSLPQRTGAGEPRIADALAYVLERWGALPSDDRARAYGVYADAFADASKRNDGVRFSRIGATLSCRVCLPPPLPRYEGRLLPIDRTPAGTLAHVASVRHVALAERHEADRRGKRPKTP